MCIGIFKPKNVVLTKRILKKSFNNNPDGAGFAYPSDNGKSIVVQRGYFGFRKFWSAYRKINAAKPMLIHFRIGTSGRVDTENCHPFLIDSKHALIHNGNLESKLTEKLENQSDTQVFVDTKLKPLFADAKLKKKRFWASAPFKWLMEETIGDSKIAILDASGREVIFNAHCGEREYGAWFSNKSYKEDRKSIRNTKITTAIGSDGKIKEIMTSASGRKIVIKYTNRVVDTSKAFVLKETPKQAQQNTDLLTGQEFLDKVNQYARIDITEMY